MYGKPHVATGTFPSEPRVWQTWMGNIINRTIGCFKSVTTHRKKAVFGCRLQIYLTIKWMSNSTPTWMEDQGEDAWINCFYVENVLHVINKALLLNIWNIRWFIKAFCDTQDLFTTPSHSIQLHNSIFTSIWLNTKWWIVHCNCVISL